MRARNSTYAQTYPSLTEDLSRADVLALADIIQRIKGIALFRIKGMVTINAQVGFLTDLETDLARSVNRPTDLPG